MNTVARFTVYAVLVLPCSAAPFLTGACVDTTPTIVADAATEAADAAPAASACVACVTGPAGCGSKLEVCRADTKCRSALSCALDRNCFGLGEVSALINCGYPCATTAGILTTDEPALRLAFSVFSCAATTCARECKYRTSADAAPD